MKRYLIIGGSVLLFFIALSLFVKFTTPSEEEMNSVEYTLVKEDLYSYVEQKGYTFNNRNLTIYLGGVDGNGSIKINNIVNEEGNYIVNIDTQTEKTTSKIHQTPSLRIRFKETPISVTVKDENGETYNKINPSKEATTSIKCDAGKYYDDTTKSCIICPKNTYSAYGDNKCSACPDMTCSPSGSTSIRKCGNCSK